MVSKTRTYATRSSRNARPIGRGPRNHAAVIQLELRELRAIRFAARRLGSNSAVLRQLINEKMLRELLADLEAFDEKQN